MAGPGVPVSAWCAQGTHSAETLLLVGVRTFILFTAHSHPIKEIIDDPLREHGELALYAPRRHARRPEFD